MPPPPTSLLRLGELTLEGVSRAGEETWFRVQPPGIGFDVGRGADRLVGVPRIFLSHGHLDHASGLPWLLSQRSLQELEATRVACPAAAAEALAELLAAAERLEGRDYQVEVEPLVPGDRVEIEGGFVVEAFAVDHVVPALGYHLIRRKRRLAVRLRGLPERRIAELARAGEQVSEVDEELWLTYCGDTGPGVLEAEPRLYRARVLLLECTFLGEATRERSAAYGHLHLDDFVRRGDVFRNEAVVLHHLSRRHRLADLRREVNEKLPWLTGRVHLLGEEEE
ncbi:MAG: MBL fold metallo-hydrolase [Thermoanaerobaculia bacterium]|nr:MBL fold metallo-hydrolase [Thermoanaerobaculia bacterium]